jgi:tetratricopeptide (TPR) repeat protein
VIARVALLVVAAAAVAFSVVALRAADARSEAFVLSADPSDADVERGLDLLLRARQGVPDGAALQIEGTLLERAGRTEDAAAVFERLVALEPENALAWTALARVAAPARAAEARERRAALVPDAG